MKKMKNMPLKQMLLLLAFVILLLAGCGTKDNQINEVPTEDTYGYVNPDESKAETDTGILIDGVLDEEVYQNNNWLYLHNDDGGNNVNIAMTSYYGEKGMYFVYDVTESAPIYVNTKRNSYMNSCIEMYLAPSYLGSVQDNSVFEIDMLPTGDMIFKKSNGQYGYTNVVTTNEKMAVLGATTKGGEVNTPECYGYCLELFIPWDYMTWLDMDTKSMRDSFVYVNPAHITSNNHDGTDSNLDRYWYFYAQQNGAEFTDVSQYFRFNGEGVMGTVPVVLEKGENCTVTGAPNVIPGMNTIVNVVPDAGYALTSIVVNGEEKIQNASFNEDGSITLTVRGTTDGVKVSAKAEAVAEGTKTLSGKIVLNNINQDSLDGLLLTYIGPKGERPLEIGADGKFELKDMEPGYYTLKAEKEGYNSVNRGIYLNQDFYTELVLEYNYFQVSQGSCWILEEQNNGVIYKMGGNGVLMSNESYRNFDYSVNLRYDTELAEQGDSDYFQQQRSGMRIEFSNGKTWHIDLMKEKDKYIVQYARFSGDNSVTQWRTVRVLNNAEIAKYQSEEGIRLRIIRQGQHMAVWLDNTLLVIEMFGDQYVPCTAKLGMEAWISNRTVMEFPFRISSNLPVDVAGSPFHWPAEIWDISNQYNGTFTKFPAPGKDTWLDSKIISNDVTTIAKDLSPKTNDYSMIYIFKFSNGDSFRVRLNHTDDDGKYRIQSFAGSTLFEPWKNHYTLTDEEAQKAMTDGISYRVQILETTAYVFIDGKEVCTYDLSTNIKNGQPSGIENATSTVSFRLDGNLNGNTVIPFWLENNSKNVTLNILATENGTVTAEKSVYKLGDTVKLAVKGADGYYYSELMVDGMPVVLDWDGTYSFETTKNRYDISASFAPGVFADNSESAWNLTNQNKGLLMMHSHDSGNSGFVSAIGVTNDVSTVVKDLTPEAKDFSMIYNFTFSNGETFKLRLNHTDDDGKYRIQSMSGSTLFAAWKNAYTLSAAETAKVQGDGIQFQVVIRGTTAYVCLDGTEICTYDLSKVVASGQPSGIQNETVSVAIRMDGNLNQDVVIPFRAVDASVFVELIMDAFENGSVTPNQTVYQVGDTVTLTVTPASGYSQKVTIDGEPLLLDWKTNTYSFVAEKNSYVIGGSFEKSLQMAPSDAGRWDSSNQAHGILSTYYPSNNDSWWCKINGEYEFLAVNAKNYLPQADSAEGSGTTGFSVVLAVTIDNGKTYGFRILNEKENGNGTPRYIYTRFGASGCVTGWGGWCALESKVPGITEKLQGDGAEFKLTRTGANILQVTLAGVTLDTYTMDGVTAANKVTSFGIYHYGNKGQIVDIPFAVTYDPSEIPVTVTIPALDNGTVTTDKQSYRLGDTVTLTIAPASGYSQKLTIDGKPLLLSWKTNSYSFVADKESYVIDGSFEKSLQMAPSDAGRWDSSNQAHGILSTYYPNNNDSWWGKINGNYEFLAVNAKNYLPQADSAEGGGTIGFSVVLAVTLDNGKTYGFRILNEKENGNGTARYIYTRYGASGCVTGWSGWCLPESKVPGVTEKLQGDGAEFKLTRTGANKLQVTLDGVVLDTYTMDGVTAANKVTSFGIYHYGNKGQKVQIPFAVTSNSDAAPVTITIPTLTNGTVTTNKQSYHVGDTVTLTVAPKSGYSQKITLDGKPVLLDWKTNSYSFVAEKESYVIGGSFVPSLQETPSDTGRWDSSNQAHGVLSTYYPSHNDSWWYKLNGNYNSIAVNAKNYLPQADSAEGGGKIGYAFTLAITLDNGKTYGFRFINERENGNGNPRYIYTRFGASGCVTGWGGWCLLESKIPGITEKLQGDGAEFKLTRIGANTLQVTLDGVVLDTYTMDGVTSANKVTSVGIYHYGNKGQVVQIPFVLTPAPDSKELG